MTVGDVVERDGFWFADLQADEDRSKSRQDDQD